MSVDLSRIEMRLRDKLCPACVRYTSRHGCSLPPDRQCAIFKNLGAIVDIVRTTQSESIGPYVDEVRLRVCAICRYEDEHGACPMREGIDCALDCYLPIVIEAVEEELDRLRHDRGATGTPESRHGVLPPMERLP
jgi:hypothetical protein